MLENNKLELKNYCLSLEVDLFGVADIRNIKNEFLIAPKVLAKLDRAVCLGLRISQAALAEIEQAPTRMYFHHYRMVNMFLDQVALRVGNYIQKMGYLSLGIPTSQIIDWEKMSAHASHRKLGVLAGLGWIGRNNLLVNKELGSQFRLVTILTDMPLEPDQPVKEDCGLCRLCVKICPAQAIKDDPSKFEHTKCFEKLREFQKQRQVDSYVCGICVNVCKGKKEGGR
ncbi:MAG: reductive dehalogenase domain-containing protein [Candidatus Omnitrophica bacterium]|jgi:epoxyqueuosine reductase QueG|nr:reductive dehalogenase domain-containing protein [Candidatus Omnitrophota bacterium]